MENNMNGLRFPIQVWDVLISGTGFSQSVAFWHYESPHKCGAVRAIRLIPLS